MSVLSEEFWGWWHWQRHAKEYRVLELLEDPSQFRRVMSVFGQKVDEFKAIFLVAGEHWSDDDMPANLISIKRAGQSDLKKRCQTERTNGEKMLIEQGWTPLHWLCFFHRELWKCIPDMVNRFNINVNAQAFDTLETALHKALVPSASDEHQYRTVRTLLEVGALTNVQDSYGRTPLQICVYDVLGRLYHCPPQVVTFYARRTIVNLILYGADHTTQLVNGATIHRLFSYQQIEKIMPFIGLTHVNWIQTMKTTFLQVISQFLASSLVQLVYQYLSLTYADYEQAYAPTGFSIALFIRHI
jgi:hypothetical protein